jgi:predicted permease
LQYDAAILGATLEATGPIFCLILLGILLKRLGVIDDRFVAASSRLVFNVCLPVLLFTTIVRIDLAVSFDPLLLGFGLLATAAGFLLSWLVVIFAVAQRADRGVVVQGSFRGNLGVIGIALCASAYGAPGLAVASLLMAVITILYNILSVIVLAFYRGEGGFTWRGVLKGILINPLIIAIVLALSVAALQITLPAVALSTNAYLGSMARALASVCACCGIRPWPTAWACC